MQWLDDEWSYEKIVQRITENHQEYNTKNIGDEEQGAGYMVPREDGSNNY